MTILHKMFLFITFSKLLQIISNNFIKILHHLHSRWNFVIRDFSQMCYDTPMPILGIDVKCEVCQTWHVLNWTHVSYTSTCSSVFMVLDNTIIGCPLTWVINLVINSSVTFFLYHICHQIPLTLCELFFESVFFIFVLI